MPTYSKVGGQHDFSIAESPDPSRACGGKESGYARLGTCHIANLNVLISQAAVSNTDQCKCQGADNFFLSPIE